MKSENFTIGLIHHGLEPAAGIPDRKGSGTLDRDTPHRHVVALLFGLGLRQTYGGECRIAEDDTWHHSVVDAATCPLHRVEGGDGSVVGRHLSKHPPTLHVSDGVDVRLAGRQLLIYLDEILGQGRYSCRLQAESVGVADSTGRQQHDLGAKLLLVSIHRSRGHRLLPILAQRGDGSIRIDVDVLFSKIPSQELGQLRILP